MFVGREQEIRQLNQTLTRSGPHLVAVYGRRRVGKTYLIRHAYRANLTFFATALQGKSLKRQLENFTLTLLEHQKEEVLPEQLPSTWLQAFHLLRTWIDRKKTSKKKVIFLDEFPWYHSKRSGFLEAFGNFWNNYATTRNDLIVVICGSAASWMIKNVLANKGSLHNRITTRIRLLPFNLAETEEFLTRSGVKLDRYSLLSLYMTIGGIPHYLDRIEPGKSAVQNIDQLFYGRNAILRDEFDNLYPALFANPERHLKVVRYLSAPKRGRTKKEIIKALQITPGGSTTRMFNELLESGFIDAYYTYGKKAIDHQYYLSDEYSLFYMKFVENRRSQGKGSWMKIAASQAWKSWSGLAFETICLKHVSEIKQELGIRSVLTEESKWQDQKAQIDLLIDRNDFSINVCEIKFSQDPFKITKHYAEQLRYKVSAFRAKTGSRKSLFLTLITTMGLVESKYIQQLNLISLDMNALFSDLK